MQARRVDGEFLAQFHRRRLVAYACDKNLHAIPLWLPPMFAARLTQAALAPLD
jgi:hypothetical protein